MTGLKEVRAARKAEAEKLAKRYSVEGIAREMGVSRPTINRWEKYPESIKVGDALKLAEILGCSVDDLICLPEKHN